MAAAPAEARPVAAHPASSRSIANGVPPTLLGEPTLSVTTIKTYFKVANCQRYLALAQLPRHPAGAAASNTTDAASEVVLGDALDPALAAAGEQQEESVLQLLAAWLRQHSPTAGSSSSSSGGGGGSNSSSSSSTRMSGATDKLELHNASGKGTCTWHDVAVALPRLVSTGRCAAWREVQLPAEGVAPPGLGVRLTGRIDFLLLTYEHDVSQPTSSSSSRGSGRGGAAGSGGRPVLVIIECKSSQQPDTSHYAQLACYRLALRTLLQYQLQQSASGFGAQLAATLASGLRCVLVTAGDLPHALRRRSSTPFPTSAAAATPPREHQPTEAVLAAPISAAAAARWLQGMMAAAAADTTLSQIERDVVHHFRHGGDAHRALAAGARESAGGTRTRAAAAALPDLEDLPFSLGSHCSSCPSQEARACATRCTARSALQLAGCGAGAAAALSARGVGDLGSLAQLEVEGAMNSGEGVGHLPGLKQHVMLAGLLQQEGKRQRQQQRQQPVQVKLHQPSPLCSVLPPYQTDTARAYIICEFDAVTQRLAAVGAHCFVGGAQGEALEQPLRQVSGNLKVWVAEGGGSGQCTFIRCAQEAYMTAGRGAGGDEGSSGLHALWKQQQQQQQRQQGRVQQGSEGQQQGNTPEGTSAPDPVALSSKKDDMQEAKIIQEFLEQLLGSCRGARTMHLLTWGTGELRRLAARCFALMGCPGVRQSSCLAAALQAVVVLLGGRGALAGLPAAFEGEQCMTSSLQQELTTRYTTPHLRPSLFDAVALCWVSGSAPFAWRRSVQLPGQQLPSDEDLLLPCQLAARRGGSQVPPAMLACYWTQLHATAAARQQVPGGLPNYDLQLHPSFAPYAAAAAPGRFEAFLAAKAESLAYLEGQMQAVGGCSSCVKKSTVPLLTGGGSKEQWEASVGGGGPGLARAALEALRLDRQGAVDEWLSDASRPLPERLAGMRSILLRSGGQELVTPELLCTGIVVHDAPSLHDASAGRPRPSASSRAGAELAIPAAASAAAGGRQAGPAGPLPFGPGDFVRVTGFEKSELPLIMQGLGQAASSSSSSSVNGGGSSSSSSSGGSGSRSSGQSPFDSFDWLVKRGANAIIKSVTARPGSGELVMELEPARMRLKGEDGSRLHHYHLAPHYPPKAFAWDYVVVDAGTSEYVGAAVDAALSSVVMEGRRLGVEGVPRGVVEWMGVLGDCAASNRAQNGAMSATLSGDSSGGSSWNSSGSEGWGSSDVRIGRSMLQEGDAFREQQQAAQVLAAVRWQVGSDGLAEEGGLQEDQLLAVVAGLRSRVQLIQGPPGTGKTEALAAAVSASLLFPATSCHRVGIVSHTHSAIDNVLLRFVTRRGSYREAAGQLLGERAAGRLDVQCARMQAKDKFEAGQLQQQEEIKRFDGGYIPVWLKRLFNGPLILGASPNDMLKLTAYMSKGFEDSKDPPFAPLDLLVIDEASMMHFSHALALVLRMLRPGGRLILAGDHRQLAAISKYDFERELRASVVVHQAHLSAYDCGHQLAQSGSPHVSLTQLSCSWRFSGFDRLRQLIAAVYRKDGLNLVAPAPAPDSCTAAKAGPAASYSLSSAASANVSGSVVAAAMAAAGERGGSRGSGGRGGAAAAALAAAGAQVLPGLLGGGVGAMLGARGVATVAAMALEFEDVEDEGETPGVNGGVVGGRRMGRSRDGGGEGGVWREVWGNWCQLVLVVHDEGASVKHNPLEVEVIKHIVMAAPDSILHQAGHLAVMSPHRAQCGALRQALLSAVAHRGAGSGGACGAGSEGDGSGEEGLGGRGAGGLPRSFKLIDTVEKLQGQEAPVVIYSATASCPHALAANSDFYSSLHRSNVALSRAKQRLVVVVSDAMLGFTPGSVGQYRELMLWKELRRVCSRQVGEVSVDGHSVRVFAAGAAVAAMAAAEF